MQNSISLKMKLGFLANDDSEEDKTSDSNWISTEDGEEDKKEISLFDPSSEAEMVTNLVYQLLQTISFPKPKSGKKHFLQIMLAEQLHMLLDKVHDQRGFQTLSTQQQVILSFYICSLLFEKPYVSELTNHTNHKKPWYMVAHGNPCMMKNSKFFLVLLF